MTFYIDKIVNGGQKKIVTFGQDFLWQGDQIAEKIYVLKIWEFHSLVTQNCKCVSSNFCRRDGLVDGRDYVVRNIQGKVNR